MNMSGIVVTAPASQFASVVQSLCELPGVEVHQQDPESGRIIVVQEAASIEDEVSGFTRICGLPHVLKADLVCHVFGDGETDEPSAAPSHSDAP